jgi:hypothetical protein
VKLPTPPKPWDIRPKAVTGSADSNAVYRAVGMALTSWEFIETALADIFSVVVGEAAIGFIPRTPASMAYGTIVGFGGRADMLDAAARGFFRLSDKEKRNADFAQATNQIQGQFEVLLKEARAFAARRNDIAHGQVNSDKHGSYLYPPFYSTKKFPMTDSDFATIHDVAAYCYTADDIHFYRQCFEDLYDRLNECRGNIRDIAVLRKTRKPS